MGLKIIMAQAEKILLTEIHGEDIMQRAKGEICDLVDQASTGQEAVEAVKRAYQDRNFQYGIIFMDCSMPIMNGYEATEKIRQYQR